MWHIFRYNIMNMTVYSIYSDNSMYESFKVYTPACKWSNTNVVLLDMLNKFYIMDRQLGNLFNWNKYDVPCYLSSVSTEWIGNVICQLDNIKLYNISVIFTVQIHTSHGVTPQVVLTSDSLTFCSCHDCSLVRQGGYLENLLFFVSFLWDYKMCRKNQQWQ